MRIKQQNGLECIEENKNEKEYLLMIVNTMKKEMG
jgi:hypothetical protein